MWYITPNSNPISAPDHQKGTVSKPSVAFQHVGQIGTIGEALSQDGLRMLGRKLADVVAGFDL